MLRAANISVRYSGRTVLNDVTLQVKKGEMTALLGPNGAGKSTLIKALNGSVPISGGSIELEGRLLKDLSRRETARRIAVVAQENETRFPLSVSQYVLAGRFARGTAFGWEDKRDLIAADKALLACELTDYSPRLMNELSGGERQRAVLARALAAETEILLLDEPTANLDLHHQALMFRLVRDRCRNSGAGAVVITHDLNLASAFTDNAVLLSEGQVYSSGRIEKVLAAENISSVYGVDVLLDKHPASGKPRVTAVF